MTGAPHIAVVGGGLAGVAAALACADAGARVSLFEARGCLGGATWSTEKRGLRVDNGQHVFMRCCTAYRGLLARLGVEDRVSLQPRLFVPVLAPGQPPAWIRRHPLPAPEGLRRCIALQVERARELLAHGDALCARLPGLARLVVAGYAAGGWATAAALERAEFDPNSRAVRPRRIATLRHALGVLGRAGHA